MKAAKPCPRRVGSSSVLRRGPALFLCLFAMTLILVVSASALAQDETGGSNAGTPDTSATDDTDADGGDEAGADSESTDESEDADPTSEDAGTSDAEDDASTRAGDETDAAPEGDADAESGAESENDAKLRTEQRVREVGTQVDALKEDTFGSKNRLLLLRESVLRRSAAGSKVVVIHTDQMGTEFDFERVIYGLDRESRMSRSGVDTLADLDGEVVIDEKITPGTHLLSVTAVLRGRPWGIFTYMEGYTFTVRNSFTFTAEEDKAIVIRAVFKEDGDFFTPIEARPLIRFEREQRALETVSTSNP